MKEEPSSLQTVQAWAGFRRLARGVLLRCLTDGRQTAEVRVTLPLPGVLRLEMAPEKLGEHNSEMLNPEALAPPAVELRSSEQELVLSSPELQVHISRRPYRLWVEDAAGDVIFAEPASSYRPGGDSLSPPLSWEGPAGDCRRFHETFRLAPDEGLFGLGAQSGPLNHHGQTVVCSGEMHWTIPFLWSTRGYGLLVHSYGPVAFDLGSHSPDSGTLSVADEQLDYFLLCGPEPAAILRRYAELTGLAPLPPRWAFGSWALETEPVDQQRVEEACAALRARLIPCDAVMLLSPGADGGQTLAWDRRAFSDPSTLVAELGEIGFRVGLSASTWLRRESSLYPEARQRGLLLRDGEGRLARAPAVPGAGSVLDLSKSAARTWWEKQVRQLLSAGCAALFLDPIPAVAESSHADGAGGPAMGARYCLLAQEAARRALGEAGLVCSRTAWVGSQRLAIPWSDAPVLSPAHLMACLRAGLGLSLSGVPFWALSLATVDERQAPALYARARQLGFLLGLACVPASTPEVLPDLGREIEEGVRTHAQLRHALAPYLYACAVACAASGLPLVSPLVLSYPEDRNTWYLDREYLLGQHLLVAPAWKLDGELEVYLPRGVWIDYWTGSLWQGGGWVRYPLSPGRVPLWVRAGAIIPMQGRGHVVGDKDPAILTLRAYPQAGGHFALYLGDGVAYHLRLEVGDGRLELQVPGLPVEAEAVLCGVPAPVAVSVDGRDAPWTWEAGEARIALGHGGRLVYRPGLAEGGA